MASATDGREPSVLSAGTGLAKDRGQDPDALGRPKVQL